MQTRELLEIAQGYEKKYNPGNTRKGRKVAHREFAKAVIEAIDSKKIGWRDISIRGLYEGLVLNADLEESLDSSAFPTITGSLISKRLIDSYNNWPADEMALVTVDQTVLKDHKVAGWTAVGQLFETKEREEYKEMVPPDEKYVSVLTKKMGGLISLTRETIKFDQTGKLLQVADAVGKRAAQTRQKTILKGVIDIDSNVYNKGQLYLTNGNNNNYISGADSVLGSAGWAKAIAQLDAQVDEQGEPIWVYGRKPVLMVPPSLRQTAFKLKNNEYSDIGTGNMDKNPAKGTFDDVVNPYYTSPSTSTKWHLGDFASQFIWAEVWPLEVMSRTGADNEDNFKRDIVLQVKADYFGGIGAIDTKYVIESKGAA